MTTPNNTHGHLNSGIEWKELYREQIDSDLFVIIVQSYDKGMRRDALSSSSHICIQSCVTNGRLYTWSNGAFSYEGECSAQVPKSDKTYKTKHGWPVWQVTYPSGANHWLVEVPWDHLLNPPTVT